MSDKFDNLEITPDSPRTPKKKGHGRQIVGGILVLLVAYFGVKYVVRKYKKPGQMTVIEAQAMDMTVMKAPAGSVPVATEIVENAPLEESVTYTGSVVAYNEVDVYPRVQGWLQTLSVYPGDQVSAGQVIAQLDTKELSSRLAEAQYMSEAAKLETHIVGFEKGAMSAKTDAAKSAVDEAKAGLAKSQADYDYWQKEIKRQEELLNRGAVSKQEYDMEKSEYEKSKSMVDEANAKVKMTENDLKAMTQSLYSVKHHVAHTETMAKATSAAKNTAGIVKGYTTIRSPLSGYVIQRMISPGVLVSPGMAILKIAQMDKVRLQANVAEADLNSIKVGNKVYVKTMKNEKEIVEASVTLVFPAADPSARTAIVEAVVDNADMKFLPGEYVTMRIVKGESAEALSVPASAITAVNEKGKPAVWVVKNIKQKGKVIYQCPMHPNVKSDKPGIDTDPSCLMKLVPVGDTGGKKAHRVYVKIGITNGERTEILKGLKDGDEVIYAGQDYLNEGDKVFPTTWGIDGPEKLPEPPGMEDMPGMKDEHGDKKHDEQKDDGGSMKNMPGM